MTGSMLQTRASAEIVSVNNETQGYVTMRVGSQLIGISVLMVHDVLRQMSITPVPLAPREVAGLMNLRGRIVTVINMRQRLGLPPFETPGTEMHAVVECKNEPYSLMVDSIGEVMNLPARLIEKTPANLEEHWKSVSSGVFRLENELLVLLDVQSLLTI